MLKDKIIYNIELSEDKKEVIFKTNEGNIRGEVEGDCICTHAWIENVDIYAELPARVIEERDLPLTKTEEIVDDFDIIDNTFYRDYYGYLITTDKGDILIDYRNDNNGYYGAQIRWYEG